MAVTAKVFLKAHKHAWSGNINAPSDTVKCALLTSTATPNQDTWEYFSDVTNEAAGTGYAAGGATLSSVAVNVDTVNNTVEIDAADVSWGTSTITARYAIFYKSTGTASTSPLMAYWDFGADESSSGASFTLSLHADGIVQITAA